MKKPVCLVTGVGPEHGTGAEIARRFSAEYDVAMLARNAANIKDLAGKYGARAYGCDVGDLDALVETIDRVKREMGPPKIVIHNALRSTRGGRVPSDGVRGPALGTPRRAGPPDLTRPQTAA